MLLKLKCKSRAKYCFRKIQIILKKFQKYLNWVKWTLCAYTDPIESSLNLGSSWKTAFQENFLGDAESKTGEEKEKCGWTNYHGGNWVSVFWGTCQNHMECTPEFSTWDKSGGKYFFVALTLHWPKVSWGCEFRTLQMYTCAAFYSEAAKKEAQGRKQEKQDAAETRHQQAPMNSDGCHSDGSWVCLCCCCCC